MLTPVDIQSKEFSRGFKGYDMDEVDDFLNDIIEDYDALIRENRDLIDKLDSIETQLDTYKGMENSLTQTMVTAHQSADELVDKAKEEADKVIEEAKAQGEEIVTAAKKKVDDILSGNQTEMVEYEARIQELNDILEEFKGGIRGYSDELLKLVDTFTVPASSEEIIAAEPDEPEFRQVQSEPVQEQKAAAKQEAAGEATAEFVPIDEGGYQYEVMDTDRMQRVNNTDADDDDFDEEDDIDIHGDDMDEDDENFYTQQQTAYVERPYTSPEDDEEDGAYYGPVELDDDEII